MKKFASYPVIRTTKFAQTVAFYEDLFGFVPFHETEGYARLHHKDAPQVMMTVIDSQHEFIPPTLSQGISGQMFTIVSDDFSDVFDALYMEGLEIVKEPTDIGNGIKHFMVSDPYNGVTINVMNEAAATPAAHACANC